MSDNQKAKAPNFTTHEIEQLKFEIESQQGILTGKLSSNLTFHVKEAAWLQVTSNVNKVGGHNRTVKQIKKKWTDYCLMVKKNIAEKLKSVKETGGCVRSAELTPEESRMTALIGEAKIFAIKREIQSEESTNVSTRSYVPYTLTSPWGQTSSSGQSSPGSDSSWHEDVTKARTVVPNTRSSSSDVHSRTPMASEKNITQSGIKRLSTCSADGSLKKTRVQHPHNSVMSTEDPQSTLVEIQSKIATSLEMIKNELVKANRINSLILNKWDEVIQVQKERCKTEKQILALKTPTDPLA